MAKEHTDALKEKFGADVLETHDFRGDDTAIVRLRIWHDAISFLKDSLGFTMMLDLCGADYPERSERFEVVVHLRRMSDGKRLRIKTRCTAEDPQVISISDLFDTANWYEREAFDLFGIRFSGHPNLKRILCHHEFEGHALRKDFAKETRGTIPTPDTLLDEMK